jgi:hypothetical protein
MPSNSDLTLSADIEPNQDQAPPQITVLGTKQDDFERKQSQILEEVD